MLRRRIHNVDPDRQGQFAAKRAAINLLWFVETCPNRTGKFAVVTGKERVGEIVGRAGLARRRNFFQTEFGPSSLPCSLEESIDQT